MKTLFALVLGFLAGSIVSSQGYGYLLFSTSPAPRPVNARFFDDQGRLLEGTDYLVQCYAGPQLDQLLPWGPTVDFASDLAHRPGYFRNAHGVVIYSIVGFGYGWVQARAWAAMGGATFEEAARNGAWTGVSVPLWMRMSESQWSGVPYSPAPMVGLRYPGSPMLFDPPANSSIRSGDSATLSVVRRGDLELYYQWYGGELGNTSQPITAATNATFTTPLLSASTNYWVKVYYSLGTTNIARVRANVTVYPSNAVWLDLSLSSPQPVIRINGIAGQRYRLESSPELGPSANWSRVTELTLPSSSFSYTDTNPPAGPRGFYRAVALGP